MRAGRLGLANVPGNGIADDAAAYAWVPAMIRFYLGEEPLLDSVPTWVLADEEQWAEVRDRLHELVLRPVAGYGGRGEVVGPACSAAQLAELQAEVAAAPHRFVAQEPVATSTAPTLVDGALRAPARGPAGVLGGRRGGLPRPAGAADPGRPGGRLAGHRPGPAASARTPGLAGRLTARPVGVAGGVRSPVGLTIVTSSPRGSGVAVISPKALISVEPRPRSMLGTRSRHCP